MEDFWATAETYYPEEQRGQKNFEAKYVSTYFNLLGGYADVIIAPQNIDLMKFYLYLQRFKFSVIVENVGDLIRMEKVSIRSSFMINRQPLSTLNKA